MMPKGRDTEPMVAMQIKELGKGLVRVQIPRPQPKPGEVLVTVKAVGINFADLLMAEGKYQEKPDMPFSPGMEVCGVVSDRGDGVEDLEIGDRIAGFGSHGGLAEYACLPAKQCVKVPESMSDEVASGFIIAYGTSHLALRNRARLKPGENLLVLGASGGVGRTAVEIGKILGANVIAAASSEAKLEEAKAAGATHLINSTTDDLRDRTRSLGGADVVYDPVGGSLFKAALRSANPEGRIIPIGFASGEIPSVPANILLVKNLDVIGCYWGGYLRFKPIVMQKSLEELFDWFTRGLIQPLVNTVLPLDQANTALEMLKTRRAIGKIVVSVAA